MKNVLKFITFLIIVLFCITINNKVYHSAPKLNTNHVPNNFCNHQFEGTFIPLVPMIESSLVNPIYRKQIIIND